MGNLKKTLDSGAVLEATLSDFEIGSQLLDSVLKELEEIKLSFGTKSDNLESFFNQEMSEEFLNTLKNLISRSIRSKEIKAALWQCFGRATYNNKKITLELFEDEQTRGDYLIVAKEVLWFNLSPFLRNLNSLFKVPKSQQTT